MQIFSWHVSLPWWKVSQLISQEVSLLDKLPHTKTPGPSQLPLSSSSLPCDDGRVINKIPPTLWSQWSESWLTKWEKNSHPSSLTRYVLGSQDHLCVGTLVFLSLSLLEGLEMSHAAMTDVLVISFLFFSSESIFIPVYPYKHTVAMTREPKPVFVSVVARYQIASKNSLKSYIVGNLCYCKAISVDRIICVLTDFVAYFRTTS